MSREMLNDEAINQVVGGFMRFDNRTQVLTYTHEETGVVTDYQILDFDKAWQLSNILHARNYHEDMIVQALKANGYIA